MVKIRDVVGAALLAWLIFEFVTAIPTLWGH